MYKTESMVYSQTEIDKGLRSYMLKVYSMMSIGLAITGVTSLLIYSSPVLMSFFAGGVGILFGLLPLAFVLVISFGVEKFSAATLNVLFYVFCITMGVGVSYWFLTYTAYSIATTFFITAAAFGSLSLYGYTTKKDLSGIGAACVMGLFGIIIAMVVNIFLGSGMMQFVISVLGVLIFAGLTAYDTQNVKEMYFEGDCSETSNKKIMMGALSFYLNFINLMQFLLMFLGQRDE